MAAEQAYDYLPSSLDGFPRPPELSQAMRSVGLQDVRYASLATGAVSLHSASVAYPSRGVLLPRSAASPGADGQATRSRREVDGRAAAFTIEALGRADLRSRCGAARSQVGLVQLEHLVDQRGGGDATPGLDGPADPARLDEPLVLVDVVLGARQPDDDQPHQGDADGDAHDHQPPGVAVVHGARIAPAA